LDSVLIRLPVQSDPNVLVGFATGDDAGVYQLPADAGREFALVQTVDFMTPIVDDPFTFGQIAAANALSDIYAMGGRPMTALSIVGYPNSKHSPEILERILLGGMEKMKEAACTVIGGHSIGDEEIKFGYAVTGLVRPAQMLTNAAARVGDRLVLTKQIGTGVISTAIKQGTPRGEFERAAVESMLNLNRAAAEAATRHQAHAATDVTGFGVLGHARGMAVASGVSLRIDSSRVGLLPGAFECARDGFLPGGLKRNREFVSSCVEFASGVPELIRNMLCDPQTSGGLLLSVGPDHAPPLLEQLKQHGIPSAEVGEVLEKGKPLITVQ
jgi:selenide, water dikinase